MNNYIGPAYAMVGSPKVQSTSKASWNETAQAHLWEDSITRTKIGKAALFNDVDSTGDAAANDYYWGSTIWNALFKSA